MILDRRHRPAVPPALVPALSLVLAVALSACAADSPTPPSGQASSTREPSGLRSVDPQLLTNAHRTGPIAYPLSPPVGGDHNPVWQNCAGDVYDAPIANEHAVHSLEHGAVWITYRPDLAAADIQALAAKVNGRQYLLMSPYPGLDAAISLQAWGFQLKVSSANDARIDDFIGAHRIAASLEPGAPCTGGTTKTGTES